MFRALVCLLLSAALGASAVQAGELLLSGFNGSGFSYSYGGFEQATGASSVRLFDAENGWGAGVVNQAWDLSGYADGRLVVDFVVNENHRTDRFLVQLNDAAGLSGRWEFVASGHAPGEPVRLVSTSTLAEPHAVYDGSGFVDTPPDLTRITNWAIEGEWDSPEPFDISFDNVWASTDVAPPPPYAGHEADAPWRAEAAARIDAIRKADLTVQVRDSSGAVVPNAKVRVRQTSHEFGFGSAVQAFRLRDDNPAHDAYKQKVAELFNVATIENNLKWPAWEGEWGGAFTQDGASRAIDWLDARGIAARGHVMVWPGAGNLPSDLRTLLDSASLSAAQQQQLRDRIAAHIAELGNALAGRLQWWDVINEPRTNHDVMDNLPEGDAAMIDWFRLAAAADPAAKLYLNEFGVLTSGGAVDTSNQRLLESQLQALIAAGAPIAGVGLQGHFSDSTLTGPEQLWRILDRYAELGLNAQVTEFDHNTVDEQLQADYLRDFLTAMFAHRGVSDVILWGFWEDAHFASDAALYRSDWSLKPNGQAYRDLVLGAWWTEEDAESGADGDVQTRAFKGTHQVTVTRAGVEQVVQVTLNNHGAVQRVTLPFLLGDYNSDGAVDAADYSVWRDALGQTVDTPGDGADGDADGRVTAADYQVWRRCYGNRPPVGESLATPEPGAMAYLLGGLVCAVRVLSR